jgi:hypothetical protein
MVGVLKRASVALVLFAIAMPACAQNKEAAISAAVTKCVAVARKYPDLLGMSKGFDAFYNAATGLVENNAFLQGQQPALFEFRKCMAASGFPLADASTTNNK